jgi:hypothetical protein
LISSEPNAYFVIASNRIEFEKKYGFQPDLQFLGNLKNSGESFSLHANDGTLIFNVTFSDRDGWPTAADGAGKSLVPFLSGILFQYDHLTNWRESHDVGGSPGREDLASVCLDHHCNL